VLFLFIEGNYITNCYSPRRLPLESIHQNKLFTKFNDDSFLHKRVENAVDRKHADDSACV
jgi:hypothetical protein